MRIVPSPGAAILLLAVLSSALLSAEKVTFDDGRFSLEIPADWYQPIAQQAVILTASKNKQDARDFLAFLAGPVSREIILAAGYAVPGEAASE